MADPLADRLGGRTLYAVVGILYVLVGAGAFQVPTIVQVVEGKANERESVERSDR